MKLIRIAEAFSRSPAGRYASDGPYSGQVFREKFLLPALNEHDRVEVDLSGTLGFGSSFLEEAFGGLVRKCGWTRDDLRRKMIVKADLKTYEERVWRYVDEARPER